MWTEMVSRRYKKHLAKALNSRTFLFPCDKLLQKHSFWKFIREHQSSVQWICEPANAWYWLIILLNQTDWFHSFCEMVYHPIWGWERNRWSSGHCAHLNNLYKVSDRLSGTGLYFGVLNCHMTLYFSGSPHPSLPLGKTEGMFCNNFGFYELFPSSYSDIG